MIRRLAALLTLAALSGCIFVHGRGFSRGHGDFRGNANDCPALRAGGDDGDDCDDCDEGREEDDCDEGECTEGECTEGECEEGECTEGECTEGECTEGECEEGECEEGECTEGECEDGEECCEEGECEEGEECCEEGAAATDCHEAGEKDGEACCATDAGVQTAAPAATDVEKLEELEYAVGAAERKLVRARHEAEQEEGDQRFAVERARFDLDDARRALRHFEGFERPTRLAKAELEFKGSRDYATEQDEEMQQLELLYEKDDLGDKTKEIVLARGRRRHQRSQENLALAKKDFEDLKGFQLEQQKQKLEREMHVKERVLHRAEITARTTAEDKQQAVADAERALIKSRREFEKAAGGRQIRERKPLEQSGYVESDANESGLK